MPHLEGAAPNHVEVLRELPPAGRARKQKVVRCIKRSFILALLGHQSATDWMESKSVHQSLKASAGMQDSSSKPHPKSTACPTTGQERRLHQAHANGPPTIS